MKLRISGRGTVCRGEAGQRAVATFPSVTVLEDGTLLAVYRLGPTKDARTSVTEIRFSPDRGQTWSAPLQPFPEPFQVVYVTPYDGRLIATALRVDWSAHPGKPLFNEETEGCLPMSVMLADSDDGGVSWRDWREVPVPDDVGPASLTNPVLVLGDGSLVVSIETNKHYGDRSPWMQRVVHCVSRDGGHSWQDPVTVCQDPTGRTFHWDQRAVVLADGRIAAFSWTYDRAHNQYLNIRRHLGAPASAGWITDELPFADQPSHPAVLPDGRVVLAWVDRYGSRSIRARAAAAVDGGFGAESEVVIHQAPAAAKSTVGTGELLVDMSMWSYGLPYAAALPDGTVMVVYYAAGEPGCMDVRWARLDW